MNVKLTALFISADSLSCPLQADQEDEVVFAGQGLTKSSVTRATLTSRRTDGSSVNSPTGGNGCFLTNTGRPRCNSSLSRSAFKTRQVTVDIKKLSLSAMKKFGQSTTDSVSICKAISAGDGRRQARKRGMGPDDRSRVATTVPLVLTPGSRVATTVPPLLTPGSQPAMEFSFSSSEDDSSYTALEIPHQVPVLSFVAVFQRSGTWKMLGTYSGSGHCS